MHCQARPDAGLRRVSYELPRFEAETLTSTFPEYEEIMPEILKASGGLPLLTDGFIQELEECKITTAEDFRAQERGLLKRYYRDHVDQMLSEGFNASTRETVLVLALLRRFDVKVLKGILPKVLAAYYDGYGTADYIELIERLGSWVYWRIQGGYAVNEAFRMALQGYVRFEKPQLYRKTHIAAEKLYEDLLQQGCRVDCLVELLYHRLALLESNNKVEPSTIPARLGDWLQEHLPGSLTTSELISLRNCLLQDPDLKDYVSEDSLNMINGLVEEAAQSEQGSVLEFQAKSA
jgi:hypothetical protein